MATDPNWLLAPESPRILPLLFVPKLSFGSLFSSTGVACFVEDSSGFKLNKPDAVVAAAVVVVGAELAGLVVVVDFSSILSEKEDGTLNHDCVFVVDVDG